MTVESSLSAKDGSVMVYIPSGEFLMGTADSEVVTLLERYPKWTRDMFANEQPQRQVYLDEYYISRTQVTVAQYRNYCTQEGRAMPPAPPWGWLDDHPMVGVNWHEASDYWSWAGMRLPTEAEWEKAARGMDGRRYPWGDTWDSSRCRCSERKKQDAGATSPTGSYAGGASPYGVLDMAGNATDWCADWYSKTGYLGAPNRNPVGPSSGEERVLRGGAWLFHDPLDHRCTVKDGYPPNEWLFWGDGAIRPVRGTVTR